MGMSVITVNVSHNRAVLMGMGVISVNGSYNRAVSWKSRCLFNSYFHAVL